LKEKAIEVHKADKAAYQRILKQLEMFQQTMQEKNQSLEYELAQVRQQLEEAVQTRKADLDKLEAQKAVEITLLTESLNKQSSQHKEEMHQFEEQTQKLIDELKRSHANELAATKAEAQFLRSELNSSSRPTSAKINRSVSFAATGMLHVMSMLSLMTNSY